MESENTILSFLGKVIKNIVTFYIGWLVIIVSSVVMRDVVEDYKGYDVGSKWYEKLDYYVRRYTFIFIYAFTLFIAYPFIFTKFSFDGFKKEVF